MDTLLKKYTKKYMYKILDLFSGLGGFSLGLERTGHFKTIAFCDNDKFSKLILDKHWKGVKIYDNVKEITKEKFVADGIQFPDIITGGFPCQPFSVAGKQKGTSDDRHLWPEMFRIIKAFKPRYVIGENVRGIINIQDGVVFETVCTDLESEGYEVQPFIIPAAGVGAPHRRERVWIIATNTDNARDRASQHETNEVGQKTNEGRQGQSQFESSRYGENVEDSRRTLRQGSELRETNEDEVREGYANQHQRSGSTSESNVANANSERPQGHGEEYELRKDSQEIKASGSSSSAREDVADTEQSRSSSESIGDIGSVGKESSKEKERGNQPSVRTSTRSTDVANTESSIGNDNEAVAGNGESSTQEIFGDGSSVSGESTWWYTEPDVGRVAHGVPGRVYRLKGLGNSIVPQIAEEIGKAIIKAEKKGGHYE
jgi:DNA (cytosine-5)-methyltransferase 1